MCNKLERLIHVVGQYNDILKYLIYVSNVDEFKKKISHIENHIENIVIEITDAICYMIFINQTYEPK